MAVMTRKILTYINIRQLNISALQNGAERLCKIESTLIGCRWHPYGTFWRHETAAWGGVVVGYSSHAATADSINSAMTSMIVAM